MDSKNDGIEIMIFNNGIQVPRPIKATSPVLEEKTNNIPKKSYLESDIITTTIKSSDKQAKMFKDMFSDWLVKRI